MTNDERSPNAKMIKQRSQRAHGHSDFVIPSVFGIRHSSLASYLIATNAGLGELLGEIDAAERVALDTEADSLHSYREKLCLLQISFRWIGFSEDDAKINALSAPELTSRSENATDPDPDIVRDVIVDPLSKIDLKRLAAALERKEIVLHGVDYDLRLLRRGLNFIASRIFDTVIAARLLGIREFGLAALVRRYFGVELGKTSQKANWGRRPLPQRMIEYAINDVHYLLPLAERLGSQLLECGRFDWLKQSCQRAIEQAAVDRVRDEDELWRIRGSASLSGPAAAVLRALWLWREKEAEAADRPPFYVLQNHELLNAATVFASGGLPDYRHFSSRRRQAFRKAAESALQLSESDWPTSRRRHLGMRPSAQAVRRAEELRQRRDKSAKALGLEQSFIAPRSALEAVAADRTRAEKLLVPWQCELLGI